jgi:NADH-quinone oxidoreductase subunit J
MLILFYLTVKYTIIALFVAAVFAVFKQFLLLNKIFSLIAVFVTFSLWLLLSGVEFLPLIILLVYVGAIAVLFLFVVMIVNPDYEETLLSLRKRDLYWSQQSNQQLLELQQLLKQQNPQMPGEYKVLPYWALALLAVVFIQSKNWPALSNVAQSLDLLFNPLNTTVDLAYFGELMYQDYSLIVIVIGVMLLVAMMGAIVLTLKKSVKLKRQRSTMQYARYR